MGSGWPVRSYDGSNIVMDSGGNGERWEFVCLCVACLSLADGDHDWLANRGWTPCACIASGGPHVAHGAPYVAMVG